MPDRHYYYLAHPLTVHRPDGSRNRAAEAANFNLCNIRAAELIRRGFNVFSPISHSYPINESCPAFLNGGEPDWYALDMQIIERTNFSGIVLAPGWSKSKGCVAERAEFVRRGLPVLFYDDIVRCSHMDDDWDADRGNEVAKLEK